MACFIRSTALDGPRTALAGVPIHKRRQSLDSDQAESFCSFSPAKGFECQGPGTSRQTAFLLSNWLSVAYSPLALYSCSGIPPRTDNSHFVSLVGRKYLDQSQSGCGLRASPFEIDGVVYLPATSREAELRLLYTFEATPHISSANSQRGCRCSLGLSSHSFQCSVVLSADAKG